ncbi:MAG: hypothetical protein JWN34_3394 [Bryobacterales bacterium]|nr:hypothetical protein [Bryobacterales bacterium]
MRQRHYDRQGGGDRPQESRGFAKAEMEKHLKIAVFIDFDNIEIGVKSTLQREFDVSVVLEAMKERGEIITKIAYANWGRLENSTRQLSEYAVQMVQRDPSPRGDKNGADINLSLDALEMAFTHDHINAFAIVSGDSDFIALVNKLKQYDKTVFVVGGKAFTSTILQKNCHEFISYESMLDYSRPSRQHHQRQQTPMAQPALAQTAAASDAPLEMDSPNDVLSDEPILLEGETRAVAAAAPVAAQTSYQERREYRAAQQHGAGSGNVSGTGGGGSRRPPALDLHQAMPLVERALQVLDRREVRPQLGLLKSTMLQLDSTFSERAYGAGSFTDFIEKLRKGDLIHVTGGEGRYMIQRKRGVVAEKSVRPEEALPFLRDVLENHRIEMEDGATVDDLLGWVREEVPTFDWKLYGFQEFTEFLNYAQDKTVVRMDPEEERGLIVFLGAEFHPPALPEPEPQPVLDDEDLEEIDEPQPIVPGQPTAHSPRVKKGMKKMAGPEINGNTASAARKPRKTAAPRKRKTPPPPGPMV